MIKKAKMEKPKSISPETGAVLDYFEDQVKVLAEHILSTNKRLGTIENAIEAVKENMEIMKMDMEFIKHGFKRKVDIDEFAALEKRVSTLENRL